MRKEKRHFDQAFKVMTVRHWQKTLAQFAVLYPEKIKLEI